MSVPPSFSKPDKSPGRAHPFDTWLSRRLHDLYASVLEEELPAELTRALPPDTAER